MTADPIVLDTDAASILLRGRLHARVTASIAGKTAITFVTVAEMLAGAAHAKWGPRRVSALETYFRSQLVLPPSPTVARVWGRVQGRCLRHGWPRQANDLWIAATCIAHDLPLLTLNVKDFDGISGLVLVELDAAATA